MIRQLLLAISIFFIFILVKSSQFFAHQLSRFKLKNAFIVCLLVIDACSIPSNYSCTSHYVQLGSSSGVCVYVTNMPAIHDFAKGFAVYSVADNDNVTVLVQTSESRFVYCQYNSKPSFKLITMHVLQVRDIS